MAESSGLVFPPAKAGSIGQRGPRRSPGAIWPATTRHGIVWPRRNSPVRGVGPDDHAEPATADIPAVDTDVDSGELIVPVGDIRRHARNGEHGHGGGEADGAVDTVREGRGRHEAMVPWEDLPDSQKDKDRALVAGIPAILSRCGYAVIPVPP